VADAIRARYPDRPVYPISAVTGEGVPALVGGLAAGLAGIDVKAEAALRERLARDVLMRSEADRRALRDASVGAEGVDPDVAGDEGPDGLPR